MADVTSERARAALGSAIGLIHYCQELRHFLQGIVVTGGHTDTTIQFQWVQDVARVMIGFSQVSANTLIVQVFDDGIRGNAVYGH